MSFRCWPSVAILSLVGVCLLLTMSGAARAAEEDQPGITGMRIVKRTCENGPIAGALCNRDEQCGPNFTCAPYNELYLAITLRHTAPDGTIVGWSPTTDELDQLQRDFTRVSQNMFDMTEGQILIRQIELFMNNGVPDAQLTVSPGRCRADGDPCMSDGDCTNADCDRGLGAAYPFGWGEPGNQMTISYGCVRNPMCFLHEFMHYFAGAVDEYFGFLPDGINNDDDDEIDECHESNSDLRCFGGDVDGAACEEQADCPAGECRHIVCLDDGPPGSALNTHGCVMRCCLGNQGPELCWEGNHDPHGHTAQTHCREGRSCWEQLLHEWGGSLTLDPAGPAPGPVALPRGPNFIVRNAFDHRVALDIQKTDSMWGGFPRKLWAATWGGKFLADHYARTTKLGVVASSTDGPFPTAKVFPTGAGEHLRLLDSQPDRDEAKTQIDSIPSGVGGESDLDPGLRLSRQEIQAELPQDLYPISRIVQFTDGEESEAHGRPEELNTELQLLEEGRIPVDVICWPENDLAGQRCAQVAAETGGTLHTIHYPAPFGALELMNASVQVLAKEHGLEIIHRESGQIQGSTTSETFYVDVPGRTQDLTFILTWAGPPGASRLNHGAPEAHPRIEIIRGNGAPVPQDDPNNGYLPAEFTVYPAESYSFTAPESGIWQYRICTKTECDGHSSSLVNWTVHVLRDPNDQGTGVAAGLSSAAAAWPEPLHLKVTPTISGLPLTGCVADVAITGPDGGEQNFVLKDEEGLGDPHAGDGLYELVFRNYTAGPGIYSFDIESVCDPDQAEYTSGHLHGPGEDPDQPRLPIQRLERTFSFSAHVKDVPANLPPKAKICKDIRAECTGEETSVGLDGTCSTDPENDPLSFEWSASPGSFPDPTAASPVGAFPLGRNQIDLAVRDPFAPGLQPDQGLVVVADTLSPTMHGVPPDETVECSQVPDPSAVTAEDACEGELPVSLDVQTEAGSCPGNYVLKRTWTAEDSSSNLGFGSQTVTVRDTTPPDISAGAGSSACVWPPNGKFVCFDLETFAPETSDDCSDPVTWEVTGCRAMENGVALDAPEDCVVFAAANRVCVRAARGARSRTGRTYVLEGAAEDACGNRSSQAGIAEVWVPHDRRDRRRNRGESCISAARAGCRRLDEMGCEQRIGWPGRGR